MTTSSAATNASNEAPAVLPVAPVVQPADVEQTTVSAATPPLLPVSPPLVDDVDRMDIVDDGSAPPVVSSADVEATSTSSLATADGASNINGDDSHSAVTAAMSMLIKECEQLAVRLTVDLRDAPTAIKAPVYEKFKEKRKDLNLLQDFLSLRTKAMNAVSEVDNPTSGGSVTGSASSSVSCSSCAGHHQDSSTKKPVVPNNLPFFQWIGQTYDDKRPVYEDIDACLLAFEDALGQYSLDLNQFWLIHIKRCLAGEVRIWLDDFVRLNSRRGESPLWSSFKFAFKAEWGPSDSTVKTEAIRELSNIKMGTNESMRAFVQRFRKLVVKSDVRDITVLLGYFNNGIPTWFLHSLTDALALAPEFQRDDLEFVMNVAKQLYEKKHSNGLIGNKRPAPSQAVTTCSPELKKSKYASVTAVSKPIGHSSATSSASSTSTASSVTSSIHSKKKQKWCQYHKVNTHNTDSCKALQRKDAAKASGQLCPQCHAPGSFPGHRCNTAVRSSSGARHGAVSASNLVHRYMGMDRDSSASSSAPFTDKMDLDSDDESLLVAAQAQACKYDERFSTPPVQKCTSLIVPIIIENWQTYALVDTGATFSAVTKEFVEFLGSSVSVAKQTGTIQLGSKLSIHDRYGTCHLKVYYNKLVVHHTFEIFDFYSSENVPVCLGMDLLPKLKIGVTGLISNHFEQTGPRLPPPIDPASLKPNDHPFGTAEERLL